MPVTYLCVDAGSLSPKKERMAISIRFFAKQRRMMRSWFREKQKPRASFGSSHISCILNIREATIYYTMSPESSQAAKTNRTSIKRNDEWDYADALGHNSMVRRIGHRLLGCEPPYVFGISGSWGAGKTSFLHKLWAYLGGDVEWEDGKFSSLDKAGKRKEWFAEDPKEFTDRSRGRKIEMVWFNPWQHQFESSPLVALLGEIRQQFSIKHKLFNEAGKLIDVALHSTLNSMTDIAKDLKIPVPSAKTVMERGREYEAEHFSTELGSQRFRDFFEGAIKVVTQGGLLVIFIDDLDRCEGDVSYRLLEGLKLYLNAKNCIYVLGIDQQHLESSIARALSGEKETWRYRPLARDYLSKMFQSMFLMPVPRTVRDYIDLLLDRDEGAFHETLRNLFNIKVIDFTTDDWLELVEALDLNLPHNPRKLKSFIASWKTHLDMLPVSPQNKEKLDWRLTLILQYLAQFEEPLYRRVEQFPNFYNQYLLPFCQRQVTRPHPLFDGLEIPAEETTVQAEIGTATEGEPGALGSPPTVITSTSEKSDGQTLPEPRFFWISRLINEVAKGQKTIEPEVIRRHLPRITAE